MSAVIRKSRFSGGARPAAMWLRSVVFMIDSTPEELGPPVGVLTDWLRRYHRWYGEMLEIDQGRHLHLLYHREVSVLGSDLLQRVPALAEVASAARECGMGFSATVPLLEAIRNRIAFDALLAAPGVSTVGFAVEEPIEAPRNEIDAVLSAVVQSKSHLAFIGPFSTIQALGLLDHPEVAGSQITIHPKDTPPEGPLVIPGQPVDACFSRLRLFVDDRGELYPCLGLLGVDSARLGNVRDPIEVTVLGGAEYALDIERLAHHGPDLTQPVPAERWTGLPWTCERHRRELVAQDAPAVVALSG